MLKRYYQLSLTEQASERIEAILELHHDQLRASGICPVHHVPNVQDTCGLCDVEDLTHRTPSWVERLPRNAKELTR